ncbi:unnamed protein product [Lathyrus oleraceus]
MAAPAPATATTAASMSFQLKISEKLGEKNFLLWRQQVDPFVNANNLQDHLYLRDIPNCFLSDDDCASNKENPAYRTWITQDQWLMTWLQSTLSPSILSRVLGCVHSYELWERILAHFQKLTRAKTRQLRAELRSTTLDDKSVNDYLVRIKALVDSLASVGDPVPDQQHIDVILEGLPQDFAPVISVIESKFDSVELEEVEALLLAHKMRSNKYKKSLQIIVDISTTVSWDFLQGKKSQYN